MQYYFTDTKTVDIIPGSDKITFFETEGQKSIRTSYTGS